MCISTEFITSCRTYALTHLSGKAPVNSPQKDVFMEVSSKSGSHRRPYPVYSKQDGEGQEESVFFSFSLDPILFQKG